MQGFILTSWADGRPPKVATCLACGAEYPKMSPVQKRCRDCQEKHEARMKPIYNQRHKERYWKRVAGTLALLPLLAAALHAQTPAAPPPVSPANWYGAGGAYNTTSPQGAGWAAYAHQMTGSLWEFDLYSAYLAKGKIVTATAAGAFIPIRSIGPIQLYAFGTVGMAIAGGNVGNAFPYGGFVDYGIGKTYWHFDAGYMQIPSSVSATQKVVLIGVGRTF